eukprot:1057243-Rhodomonas_salina.2
MPGPPDTIASGSAPAPAPPTFHRDKNLKISCPSHRDLPSQCPHKPRPVTGRVCQPVDLRVDLSRSIRLTPTARAQAAGAVLSKPEFRNF